MLISFMTWREWGKRRRQQCEVQREGDLVVQSETIVFLWRTTTTDGSLVFGERKAEQEQHTKKLIFLSRLGGLNILLSDVVESATASRPNDVKWPFLWLYTAVPTNPLFS